MEKLPALLPVNRSSSDPKVDLAWEVTKLGAGSPSCSAGRAHSRPTMSISRYCGGDAGCRRARGGFTTGRSFANMSSRPSRARNAPPSSPSSSHRPRPNAIGVTALSTIRHRRQAEPIVFVAAAAVHRRAAFNAADYLMDQLKTGAPFWKREHGPAGSHWIEPRAEDYIDLSRWDRQDRGS